MVCHIVSMVHYQYCQHDYEIQMGSHSHCLYFSICNHRRSSQRHLTRRFIILPLSHLINAESMRDGWTHCGYQHVYTVAGRPYFPFCSLWFGSDRKWDQQSRRCPSTSGNIQSNMHTRSCHTQLYFVELPRSLLPSGGTRTPGLLSVHFTECSDVPYS